MLRHRLRSKTLALVGLLIVVGCGSTSTPPTSTPPRAIYAVVDTVLRSPVLTEFYGRSCQGLHGTWFLNVVQGGSNQVLHPSYRLDWSFIGGSSVARPSGPVATAHAGKLQATVTLTDGVLRISGVGPTGSPVSGQGTLSIGLSGSAAAPVLTLTETGLTTVEQELDLQSPFVASGGPVTVPIHMVSTAAGCNAH